MQQSDAKYAQWYSFKFFKLKGKLKVTSMNSDVLYNTGKNIT